MINHGMAACAFRWSEGNVDELITLYEARPCLYDVKSKDYSNRDLMRKAMAEIAIAFGITGQNLLAMQLLHICSIIFDDSQLQLIIMRVSMIPLTPYGHSRWGLHCQIPPLLILKPQLCPHN